MYISRLTGNFDMIRKAFVLILFLLITPMVFVITAGCSENESVENQAVEVAQAGSDGVGNTDVAPASDTAKPVEGGPKIHFAEPTHDFGSVLQGEELTHTFMLTNLGDEPLKLIRAKAT